MGAAGNLGKRESLGSLCVPGSPVPCPCSVHSFVDSVLIRCSSTRKLMCKKGQCWVLTLIKRLGGRRTPGPIPPPPRRPLPGYQATSKSTFHCPNPRPLAGLGFWAGFRVGCVLDFWAKRQITFLFGFDVVAIATVIPFA